MSKIKSCPFCGSNNIGYSIKTMGRNKKYHVAMYCKDCNCYGKRTIVEATTDSKYTFRSDVEKDLTFKQIAINAWNTRSEDIAITVLNEVYKRINWLSEEIPVSRCERRNNLKMMLSEMDYCKRMLEGELQK